MHTCNVHQRCTNKMMFRVLSNIVLCHTPLPHLSHINTSLPQTVFIYFDFCFIYFQILLFHLTHYLFIYLFIFFQFI